MASEKKKRKLKNSYCVPSALKNKLPHRCKRILFYTSSQRQQEKQGVKEIGWCEDNNRAIQNNEKVVAKVQTEDQRNFLLKKLNNKYVKHLRSNYV